MDEAVVLLKTHLRMVWRYRWIALLSAGLICAGGWTAVLLMPNQYGVSTKIYLDTRSLLRPLLRGLAVSSNRVGAANMMRRTLLVRSNLETVIRKTDMDLKASTPAQFEALISNLQKTVRISGTKRDNIFVISYRHQDPKLATRVVEALLNLFVERSLGDSRKDTTKTKQFLDAQIKEYESRLNAAEARLKEFKQRNVGMMPKDGANYFSKRQAMASQLQNVKLELREAEQRMEALRRQVEGEEPSFGLGPAPAPSAGGAGAAGPYDGRIEALETKLDELLIQYTDRHPDVISARRRLASLQELREKELKERPPVEPESAPEYYASKNPVYQSLKVSYGSAVAQVAGLKTRVAEYERRLQNLSKLVDTVPEVEAELKRLNRDYGLDKRNYNELVKRRESLKLGEEASQTAESVQFNIIEPPREPLKPNTPDRPRLNGMVLGAALAAGLGIAWLIGMLRPSVYTREGLTEIGDLPVLGQINRMWTQRERVKRRMEVVVFGLGCLFLVSAFGGLMALDALDVDLPAKAASLKERIL